MAKWVHTEPAAAKPSWRVRAWTWTPLGLGLIAFLIYAPSLGSGLVYDARKEIVEEGFITNLRHLPDVLTLKTLVLPLNEANRPGALLYLMLVAAFSGPEAWGYHLCGNLLHGANVALLLVVLRRLVPHEGGRARLAVVAVTLLFAVHPLAVESVAQVSYASTLLSAFFTLVTLLIAIHFRPDHGRAVFFSGAAGAASAFAAAACKESGVTAALLPVVYWLLFRRGEAKGAWLGFLGATMAGAAAFLIPRFLIVPPPGNITPCLGGSFAHVFVEQPRLWVFMMGQIVWPSRLSTDYTLDDLRAPSAAVSLLILAAVVAGQIWLARRSRIGALGVALYWLALATVSNFVPLNRIVADRFYYLPLAGVAMQALAGLQRIEARRAFVPALAGCFVAALPLGIETLARQAAFTNDFAFWNDMLRNAPHSTNARLGLGWTLFQAGRSAEAVAQFRAALALDPTLAEAHYNLGMVLTQQGHSGEGVTEFEAALQARPAYPDADYNLGNVLLGKGEVDAATAHYRAALAAAPRYYLAYNNLGVAWLQSGKVDDAITAFQQAIAINPDFADAHDNLGLAYAQKNEMARAAGEFAEAVRLEPDDPGPRNNLARAEMLLREKR